MDLQGQVAHEFEFGIVCLLINLVTFQIKVHAPTPRELAIEAWNAQWLLIVLSALFDCNAGSNLQCATPLEALPNEERLHITNYNTLVLKSARGQPPALREADAEWLEAHHEMIWKMLDDERLQHAVHCLATYHHSTRDSVGLAALWSGIEGLFGIDAELSHRIALYCANLLEATDPSRRDLYKRVRALYTQRSRAVHGGKKCEESAVNDSAALLRRLVKRCIEDQALPKAESLNFPKC